jgi:hypothetical protein
MAPDVFPSMAPDVAIATSGAMAETLAAGTGDREIE